MSPITEIPAFKLGQLAQLIAGQLNGDPELTLQGFNPEPSNAKSDEICFIFSKRYLQLLNSGEIRCGACIVPGDAKITAQVPYIAVDRPKLVIKQLLELFAPRRFSTPAGIHPTAVISENVQIADSAKIGAHVFIAPGTQIDSGSEIQPGVYLGKKVKIGKQCIIKANVVIEDDTKIGDRVVIHPGAVIGADGFSYVHETETILEKLNKNPANFRSIFSDVKEQSNPPLKVLSAGSVIIEDDVEIGANTCIDRGTLGATVIGKNSKIDNLVQIGHNCKIAEECLIAGQSGMAGSAKLGARVILGGHAGCRDGTEVAHDSVIMATSHVHKDVPPFSLLGGDPAVTPEEYIDQQRGIRRASKEIPKLKKQIQELNLKIEKLLSKDAASNS